MSVAVPHIECHHCAGSGRVKLPPHLAETLGWLRLNGPADAAKALEGLGADIGRTGMINRLNDLCRLGFARRWRAPDSHVRCRWVYEALGAVAASPEAVTAEQGR